MNDFHRKVNTSWKKLPSATLFVLGSHNDIKIFKKREKKVKKKSEMTHRKLIINCPLPAKRY